MVEALRLSAIIGESEAIKKAVAETQRVAQTEATVLLLGESGTGKELFARAVHHLSNRRDNPLVAINCAAIPETLIENELFGTNAAHSPAPAIAGLANSN